MQLNGWVIAVLGLWLRIGHSYADPRVIAYENLRSTAEVFSEPRISHFSQLLFNGYGEQQELIVGARDAIYRLTVDQLQPLEKAEWKASDEKIYRCTEKGQSETDCKNYIKVLLTNGNELLACGTNAFSPNCTWRELKNVNKIVAENTGIARCPHSPHANVTSLISDDGSFFAGTPLGFAGTDSAIVRSDNKLPFLRTTQYDSKSLNEPQFVGSFETNDFVYFLFREEAVEYMNCGKAIYSRIARVCKKDLGDHRRPPESWTTFVKARLNCSLPGEYPFYFNEIRGFTYLPDNGLVYATFTTPRNSIPGSAVCLFNLTAVNAAFNGPYKHQRTIGSTWESVSNDYPKQCQNYDVRGTFSSSQYQLMDNAVQPVTKTPLYHNQLENIVHIAVDEVVAKRQREKTVIYVLYVSNEDNVVKKMSVLPDSMKTCVLEIWKPISDPTDRILTMHYLKEKESLYIGTENEVLKIPSQHCHRYKSKHACMDSKDPYCGWNEFTLQCTSNPDKTNPSTFYWNQNISDCPTFSHPVPGDWSAWSAWVPCSQGESLNQNDQCMCSTRQCNNPAPQNGGAECEGVHIKVTNCTTHGDWTEWSEWSACNPDCGKEAVKIRKRTCTNPAPAFGGRVCVGQDSEIAVCFDNPPCPPPTPVYSCPPWGLWTECSAKCGDGYQFRVREITNKLDLAACSGNTVEIRKCYLRPCSIPSKITELTSWECTENEIEQRHKMSCEVFNSTSLKIFIQREERNAAENVPCSDVCGPWSNWSDCDHFNSQERFRKCSTSNKGRKCRCNESEKRYCQVYRENPVILESGSSISTVNLLLACFLSFILGICALALFCYYKMKKEQHMIPSSPLYATKQNFYVNVPLREPPVPKRTPSFSKNSILTNGSAPKVFTKPLVQNGGTIKAVVKPMEYDTATIKRNSNNLKNGYSRNYDSDIDADRFS